MAGSPGEESYSRSVGRGMVDWVIPSKRGGTDGVFPGLAGQLGKTSQG